MQAFGSVSSQILPPFINKLIDDLTDAIGLIEGTINPDGDLERLIVNSARLLQCAVCLPTVDPSCAAKCGSIYGPKLVKEIIKGSVHLVKLVLNVCLNERDNAECSFKIKPCVESLENLLLKQCRLL